MSWGPKVAMLRWLWNAAEKARPMLRVLKHHKRPVGREGTRRRSLPLPRPCASRLRGPAAGDIG